MIEFDGPHFEPGLIGPDGRLTRFCKGSDNSAAIKEQKAARKQSAQQFATQMLPASPVPVMGMDTKEAGRNLRRQSRRRFGAGKTVFAGESVGAPSLGGAVALAA